MMYETSSLLPTYSIQDDRFDPTLISEYHLVMEIHAERFRFAVFNDLSQTFIWLEDYQTVSLWGEDKYAHALRTIIKNHSFLGAHYWKSIALSTQTPAYTLMPTEFFDPSMRHKYLAFSTGSLPEGDEKILAYEQSTFHGQLIYTVEGSQFAWLKTMYPGKKVIPAPAPGIWLEGLLRQPQADGYHMLVVDGAVTLALIRHEKVKYLNTFTFRTPEDFTYYVLFVAKELDVQPDEPKKIYGEMTSFSDIYQVLSAHVEGLQFASLPVGFKFSQYFEGVPPHRYFSLFSLRYLSSL